MWNDFKVLIMINIIKYIYFQNLIFIIIVSVKIIINYFFFNLIDDCEYNSFSIFKFKILFIFKLILKKNIVLIIFTLNF
jgi:hypothetical protein